MFFTCSSSQGCDYRHDGKMSVVNLYSKQQKALTSQGPGIFTHDELPKSLRFQFVHVLRAAMGSDFPNGYYYPASDIAKEINHILCKEYGVPSLVPHKQHFALSTLTEFFLEIANVEQCLDVIQVAFTVLKAKEERVRIYHPEMRVNEAITELNERFKEHGIGFQFLSGQILRLDSQFAYQEMTVPALKLLEQPYLQGANQEFLSAHDHYRHGRYKECLNECLKAFESTLKAICHKRKWKYDQKDTAKTLIKICEDNKLFPVFMESHLTGLRTTLEAGVPTARNKTSGHGQGVVQITVSEQFAAYVLNLTAANIRFLAESEQALE